MRISRLEALTRQDIELKASKLLQYYRSGYFNLMRPTHLQAICDYLYINDNIQFHFNANLGFNKMGNRVLGLCNPHKRVILIDSSLSDEFFIAKFNFTLAHELGHLALHRKIMIERTEVVELDSELRDTDEELKGDGRKMITDNDWMEWQANNYAASLLMPERFVKLSLQKTKEKHGISNRLVGIYVDEQQCNIKDFYNVTTDMASYFGVSRSSIEYRLNNLGLIERNLNGVKSVKQILRDMNFGGRGRLSH